MRIPSPNVSPNIKTPQNGKQKGVSSSDSKFTQAAKKTLAVDKKIIEKNMPISRRVLMQLALDYKNGAIDKKEANSRFVSAVINNSIQEKLGEKDRQKITDDIEKFFSEDQDFLQKLAKNLNDLA